MRSCLKEQPNSTRVTKWRQKKREQLIHFFKPRKRLLHHHRHHDHPSPFGSCCSSSLHALGEAAQNWNEGASCPSFKRLYHGLVLRRTAVCWGLPADSWCPPHLCLRGSTEPSREEVGWPNPPRPLWLLMPYYWMLTMNLPCLSACLSNSLSLMCLSVTSAVNLHQVPYVITFLQTLHWPPSTLMMHHRLCLRARTL